MSPTLTARVTQHKAERVIRSVSHALIPGPAYKNSYGQRSFFHTYTKLCNETSYYMRTLTSAIHFKQEYKHYLMEGHACNH